MSRISAIRLLFFAACVGWLTPAAWSQQAVPKISEFAPVEDLLGQVDFFIGRATESLADPADFDGAKQSRTVKDASTLAVLALMLSMHDHDFASKAGMPSLLVASRQLADAGDNYDRASQALSRIKSARAGTADSPAAAPWEKAASLSALMKQVPLVHNGLKRSIEGNRLAQLAKQSAGQAATLAAIAQAAMLDTEPVKTPEDAEKWRDGCLQMRDAAGAVNAAIHAADRQRVTTGMKQLFQSCETCHAAFRNH